MVEENVDIWPAKMFLIVLNLLFLVITTSSWNFWILNCWNPVDWFYYLLTIIYFYLLFTSPWLKKIWNLTFWNAQDWLDFAIFWQSLLHHAWRKFWNLTFWNTLIEMILLLSDNYFTMAEEKFEIWHSETLQIGIILRFSDKFDLLISRRKK